MAEYQKIAMTDSEKAIFEDEWDKLWTRHFRFREVNDVMQDHKAAILEACEIAKYQLEASFGGANCNTNEFGWCPIQHNFLVASAAVYSTATWVKYWTTANVVTRFNDYIGSSTTSLKMSKYGTMIIVGFADPVDVPKVDAILAKVKGRDYPIWYLNDAFEETDYHVAELAVPLVVEREQEIYLQALVGRAGMDLLRPLGVYFGKGDHLRSTTAYAQV